jgi:hypothetical protein
MGKKLGYLTALLVAASIPVAPVVTADPGTTPVCAGGQIPVIDGCIVGGPQGTPVGNPENSLPFEDSPAGRPPGTNPLVPYGVAP